MLLWVQLRDTPASDIQFRLDHERRMRATTEEREAVASLPQVRLFSLNAFREWAQEQRHHSLLGFLSLLVEQNFKCTTPSDGKESFSIFIEWIVLDQHWCDTVFSMRYQWNCSSFDSSLSLILLSFATKFVFVHNFVFFSLMFCILGTLWFIPNCLLGNLIPNHQISDHFLLNCHQFTYKLHGPEFDDMYWLVWNFSFIYQILFKI